MTMSKAQGSKKKPDAATLQKDPGYSLILELDFGEMIPFVLSNIQRKNGISLLYFAVNATNLFFILFYIIWGINSGTYSGGQILGQCAAGILGGSILVIPPHELLHGLAYRLLGARRIKFGADLQQFIFYVTADRFPISKRELAFLAMTPFVIINLVCLCCTLWWAPHLCLFSAVFLFCHNIMCIGDFAMLSYVRHNKRVLYTFDNIQNKKSYFYSKSD
jgi:Putative zincin peptidase